MTDGAGPVTIGRRVLPSAPVSPDEGSEDATRFAPFAAPAGGWHAAWETTSAPRKRMIAPKGSKALPSMQ
jgi:hypothetical protein